MIKLNDLAIGYNGEAILEHIDQEFDDGLIYGILAKSGAGKTTLLKTISGLLHPVHGEVVIDGTTYRNADKNPVYMMHQRYSNFGWLSCTENVLIAQRDKKLRSRDDAIKVLAAVGLEQYADKWPSQLSGGMQQRLALARTLYVKPKYIGIDNGVCDKKKSPYYGMPWAQVAQIRLEAIDHEPADEPERHRPLGEGTTEGVCTPSGVSA